MFGSESFVWNAVWKRRQVLIDVATHIPMGVGLELGDSLAVDFVRERMNGKRIGFLGSQKNSSDWNLEQN